MTERRRVGRNLLIFLGLATAMTAGVLALDVGTALRDPTFSMLTAAKGSDSPWLASARVRVAGELGGRADVRLTAYGDQSALEVAAERQMLTFIREALRYASVEHAEQVLRQSCDGQRTAVVRVLKEAGVAGECD